MGFVSLTLARGSMPPFTNTDVAIFLWGALFGGASWPGKSRPWGKKTSLNVSSNYALIAEKYNMDITASDTFSKDIELLLAGRTDCVINNTIAFNDFLTQKPDTPIKIAAVQEQADTVAVPIPKGNDDLVEAVNKAIAELQADGTLTELSNKYLGKDFSKELTLEEIQQ